MRTVPEPEVPGAAVRLSALTSKPVLYVANVAEGEPLEPPPALAEHARERAARAAAVSARLDSELSELDDDEASAMREELGVAESGLETVIREAFALLDLIQFFTAGQDAEARAIAIPEGRLPVAPRARCIRTWSGASWPPRSRPGMRWWRPAATRRPASGPCSGWRGAGTWCRTGMW